MQIVKRILIAITILFYGCSTEQPTESVKLNLLYDEIWDYDFDSIKEKEPRWLKVCYQVSYYQKEGIDYNKISEKLQHNQQIFLCAYHIDTDYLKPYLSYLLYNYSESSENLFYFPFFSFNDSINLQKQVIEQFTFLTKFDVKPLLSGYIKHNNEYYFFLDIKSISDQDKRDNNYVWCLIDEIVNTKKIYNILAYELKNYIHSIQIILK